MFAGGGRGIAGRLKPMQACTHACMCVCTRPLLSNDERKGARWPKRGGKEGSCIEADMQCEPVDRLYHTQKAMPRADFCFERGALFQKATLQDQSSCARMSPIVFPTLAESGDRVPSPLLLSRVLFLVEALPDQRPATSRFTCPSSLFHFYKSLGGFPEQAILLQSGLGRRRSAPFPFSLKRRRRKREGSKIGLLTALHFGTPLVWL